MFPKRKIKKSQLRYHALNSIPHYFNLNDIATDINIEPVSPFTVAFNGSRYKEKYLVRHEIIPLFTESKLGLFPDRKIIDFPVEKAEDARCFDFNGEFCCLFNDSVNMYLGYVEKETCILLKRPSFKTTFEQGVNHREKNWSPFVIDGQLHVYYSAGVVLKFPSPESEPVTYITEQPTWDYGLIRGGTQVVPYEDKLYTVFHTVYHEPKLGLRVYLTGLLELQNEPPFKALRWSRKPLWIPRVESSKANIFVSFPCHLEFKDNKAIIIAGCNDKHDQEIIIPWVNLQTVLQ